jgi:hypothetical protein
LLEKLLDSGEPPAIAYIESHAGAGLFHLDRQRQRHLEEDRKQVEPDEKRWKTFDTYNRRIRDGIYYGSFALALKYLAASRASNPQRTISSQLWEKDPSAIDRIRRNYADLIPGGLDGVELLHRECSPELFIASVVSCRERGQTVVWLCDPFFGNEKKLDRQWFALLEVLSNTFGILFSVVGGNSHKEGRDKFNYQEVLGAPRPPDESKHSNVRSYGLYFTETAAKLLGPK